jgi:hypothetical protein
MGAPSMLTTQEAPKTASLNPHIRYTYQRYPNAFKKVKLKKGSCYPQTGAPAIQNLK